LRRDLPVVDRGAVRGLVVHHEVARPREPAELLVVVSPERPRPGAGPAEPLLEVRERRQRVLAVEDDLAQRGHVRWDEAGEPDAGSRRGGRPEPSLYRRTAEAADRVEPIGRRRPIEDVTDRRRIGMLGTEQLPQPTRSGRHRGRDDTGGHARRAIDPEAADPRRRDRGDPPAWTWLRSADRRRRPGAGRGLLSASTAADAPVVSLRSAAARVRTAVARRRAHTVHAHAAPGRAALSRSTARSRRVAGRARARRAYARDARLLPAPRRPRAARGRLGGPRKSPHAAPRRASAP